MTSQRKLRALTEGIARMERLHTEMELTAKTVIRIAKDVLEEHKDEKTDEETDDKL